MAKEKTEHNTALQFVGADDTAAGFEGISMDTMAIPFIQILQKGSPQVNEKKPEYIPGAKAGMFYNSVTKKVYADVGVVVLSFEHIYTEWKPERGGFVGRHSVDEADRLAVDKGTYGKWKTAAGNDLVENYVYFVLIVGEEASGPAVISLASTNLKVGKEWNRMMTSVVMANGRKAMPYYLQWFLTTEYKENDKGDWYMIAFKQSGFINESQYAIIVPERKALPGKSVDYAQITGGDTPERKDHAVEY